MSITIYGNTNLLTTLAYEEELEETLNTMVMLSSFIKKNKLLKEQKAIRIEQEIMTKWLKGEQDRSNLYIINTMAGINIFEDSLKRRGVNFDAPKNLITEWDKMCSQIGKFDRLDLLYKKDYTMKVYLAIQNHTLNNIAIVANAYAKRQVDLETFQKFSAKQREIGYYYTSVLLYNQKAVLNMLKDVQQEYEDIYKKKMAETDKMIASINKELAKVRGYATIIMIKQLGKGVK